MLKVVMIIGCLILAACGNTVSGIGRDITTLGNSWIGQENVDEESVDEESVDEESVNGEENVKI